MNNTSDLQQVVSQMTDSIMKNVDSTMKTVKKKESPCNTNEIKYNENDSFKCSVCFKAFSSASKLTRHTKTHSGEMPYKCKVCHKAFSHSGNFKVFIYVSI